MWNVVPFRNVHTSSGVGTRVDEFITALGRLPEFARHDYRLEQSGQNEIVISHNEHVLGVWCIVGGCYLYTPASSRQPTFQCHDVTSVMSQVRKLLAAAGHASPVEHRRHWRRSLE
jgi:hypothetical protein